MASVSVVKTMEASTHGATRLIEFCHAHHQNPFSMARMNELTGLLLSADDDASVASVVLYGGIERSFAVGGDFNEVADFVGGVEVDEWIDVITTLYTTVAGIRKPVVSAIDGFAIGIGLQIALCSDYRVGSEESVLVMPEFKLGIACNFGGYLLEAAVSRAVMQHMLFTCEEWNAERAKRDGLLHEVVRGEVLLDRGFEVADAIGAYTRAAVQGTRPGINAVFVEGLQRISVEAKVAHRKAFAAGEAQERMREIIGARSKPAT